MVIGAVSIIVGPAARFFRKEIEGTKSQYSGPQWKLIAFTISLGSAIVLLWPLSVASSWSEERKRKRKSVSSLIGSLDSTVAIGDDEDKLPNAYGEFGLEATNPVLATALIGSTRYLDNLRTSDGQEVSYTRIGSTLSDVSRYPIDIYDVRSLDDEALAIIYILPYNKTNSSISPRGFTIPSSSNHIVSVDIDDYTNIYSTNEDDVESSEAEYDVDEDTEVSFDSNEAAEDVEPPEDEEVTSEAPVHEMVSEPTSDEGTADKTRSTDLLERIVKSD